MYMLGEKVFITYQIAKVLDFKYSHDDSVICNTLTNGLIFEIAHSSHRP